jgi:hypothetical protein
MRPGILDVAVTTVDRVPEAATAARRRANAPHWKITRRSGHTPGSHTLTPGIGVVYSADQACFAHHPTFRARRMGVSIRTGGAARVLRSDPGPHPAVRRATATRAAWLTRRPNEVLVIRVGARICAERKRVGMVVPQVTEARLARWSRRTGGFTAESAIPAGIERL